MPLPPKPKTPEDNPYWPLPPDYPDLHPDDQAKARVTACTSWYDPARPTLLISDPEAFIVGFSFWKRVYRKKNPRNRAKYAYKDAPYHDEWIEIIAHNRRSVLTAFRDSGKTMVLAEELPEFVAVTRPNTPIQYTTSADDLTEKQVRAVRLDIESNELQARDFGVMRPGRGSSLMWTKDYIELNNGSSMKGVTAFSKQRGSTQLSLRPVLAILDDWEVDKRLENKELREDAEDYLFNVLFPMLEPGAWIVWPNTLLHLKAWAMIALHHEDPRFDSWFTKQWLDWYWKEVPGEFVEENGERVPKRIRVASWPDRFPLEKLDAMAGTGNAEMVGLGEHAYNREMRHILRSKSGAAFEFDSNRHTFYWKGTADRKIVHDVETGRDMSWEELKERSIGIIGTDLALGRSYGDYAAVISGRLDDTGTLWVLEEWVQKISPMDTLYQALTMAEYWEALAIAVEKVNFEQVAIDQLEEELNRRRTRGDFACEVYICNRAGTEAKKIRTLRLQYRFREHKIKIATRGDERMMLGRGCPVLLEQVENFSYTGGNLKHDDALDALVAVQEAFVGIGRVAFSPARSKGLIDQMREARRAGVVYWPGADKVDAREIATELLREHKRKGAGEDDFQSFADALVSDWMDTSIFEFDW